ncbi:hypothetical protein B0H11DRAFT_2055061 [Mycena galericulata]|nr:hypothetical protein B0H11DRAFT_2055061 [Mycena galericulata]
MPAAVSRPYKRAFWGPVLCKSLGSAGQLFRHLTSILIPSLPRHGDLSTDDIAAHLGPSIDFWRVVTGTPDFWSHAIMMSRQLKTLAPIVTSTGSNPVFNAFAGPLHLVWRNVPAKLRKQLMAGQSPYNLAEYLPPPHNNGQWHPTFSESEYFESVGGFFIAKYGPDSTDLTLLILNLHPGVSKYRPAESYFSESIILAVSAMERLALQIVQGWHEEKLDPDRSDEQATRSYLTNLKKAVEDAVVKTGLRKYLDNLKARYRRRSHVSRYLESKARPSRSSPSSVAAPSPVAPPYEIPGLTNTSTLGTAREAQLTELLAFLTYVIDGGFPKEARMFVPFHHRDDVHSEAFRTWFLELAPGIRISYSARVWGNDEQAHQNTLNNQERFAADTAAHSRGGLTTAGKSQAAKSLGILVPRACVGLADPVNAPPQWIKKFPLGSLGSQRTWRGGVCNCGGILIAEDNNAKHECPDGRSSFIRDMHFPQLQRFIYPHDLFSEMNYVPYVPNPNPLARLDVQDVLARAGNVALAKTLFPETDFAPLTGSIYVSRKCADPIHDNNVHVAMALDVAVGALSLSRCPPELWPTIGADRAKAWQGHCEGWLDIKPKDKKHKQHYVVTCDWGYFAVMTRYQSGVFEHQCTGANHLRTADPATGKRIRGAQGRGGAKDCGTQRSHAVDSIYDLPPDYIRRLVYYEFIAKFIVFPSPMMVSR